MPQYAPVFELATLDGNNGFKLPAAHHLDLSGFSVSSAGDVNGDGFDDIVIGAPHAGANYNETGRSFVVFGKAGGFAAEFNLTSLDGNNGFAFTGGTQLHDRSGWSVASAGDVNGDGFSDVIVGAFSTDPNANYSGSAYVVFGKTGGFDATIDQSDLDGANGFAINGEQQFGFVGWSVSAAGDVNGDSIDDVIVGATGEDVSAGAAYIVFGKTSAFLSDLDLSSLDGHNGFRVSGVASSDTVGYSVSSAGDVNGDGVGDIIVGGNGAPNGQQAGASYVVFGSTDGFGAEIDLGNLTRTSGFAIKGLAAKDYAGVASSAGDINGDGIGDIVVGARGADPYGADSGAAYVIFGTAKGVHRSFSLATLDGTNGFKVTGSNKYDAVGVSVESAGDANGDGFDDLVIGAQFVDSTGYNGVGAAYIVFGKASPYAAQFKLSSLDGNDGFCILGEDQSYGGAGNSVASAGDVNGDGFADIVIGASRFDNFTGASYVVFGAMPGEAVTRTGTAIGNVIHGGNLDDRLNGLGGADVLIGHDGHDLLNGGKSGDTLNGGAGADMLNGGQDADIFLYDAPSDSTGASYDTVVHVDFAADRFDLNTAISGIDAEIEGGKLRGPHFDGDLAAAADTGHLGAHHAVLFSPSQGSLAGDVFLIIDVNGTAGYQSGQDIVVRLTHAENVASLSSANFI